MNITPRANPFRLTAVASALVLMSACGGGGGGGGHDDPVAGSTAKASGSAIKGVISNGNIEAVEIVDGKLLLRGTAKTDAQGRYDLDIAGYTNGPLIIQVTGGGSATTKCDVRAGCNGVAFGDTLPLASGFVMRTLLPKVEPGAALTRCITPFTDLAARRAQEVAGQLANVTALQATRALSEVSQLVGGIDVLRTCAVDLTDADDVEEADTPALALSGLTAAVLATSSDKSNPSTALSDLGSRFAGGVISTANLQALLTSALGEVEQASPGEKNTAYMDMQDDIDGAAGSGSVNPEPSAEAEQPQIEQGKALIDEVRSLALNLAADAEDVDDASNGTVEAFRTQLEVARSAVDNSHIGDAFSNVFDAAAELYESVTPGSPAASIVVQTTASNSSVQVATVTVNRPASGNATVTITGRSGDFAVNLTATAPQDPAAGGTTPTNLTATVTGTMQTASGVGLKATLNGNATATGLTFDEATGRYDGAGAAFHGTATFEQIGVADPFRFSGNLDFNVVDCTTCAASVVLEGGEVDDSQTPIVDSFALDGTFSNSKGSFEAAIGVDMDNLAFDRRLPVSADNVPSGTVSMQLDAQLDGFHEYHLALVLDLNDITTFAGGTDGDIYGGDASLQASFRRDGKTITVQVKTEEPTATSSVIDVTITNQDGVRFEFDNVATDGEDNLTGAVFVGETRVGTVEQTSRGVLIRWVDGTFESLG